MSVLLRPFPELFTRLPLYREAIEPYSNLRTVSLVLLFLRLPLVAVAVQALQVIVRFNAAIAPSCGPGLGLWYDVVCLVGNQGNAAVPALLALTQTAVARQDALPLLVPARAIAPFLPALCSPSHQAEGLATRKRSANLCRFIIVNSIREHAA